MDHLKEILKFMPNSIDFNGDPHHFVLHIVDGKYKACYCYIEKSSGDYVELGDDSWNDDPISACGELLSWLDKYDYYKLPDLFIGESGLRLIPKEDIDDTFLIKPMPMEMDYCKQLELAPEYEATKNHKKNHKKKSWQKKSNKKKGR